jgi:hypothetical protein
VLAPAALGPPPFVLAPPLLAPPALAPPLVGALPACSSGGTDWPPPLLGFPLAPAVFEPVSPTVALVEPQAAT